MKKGKERVDDSDEERNNWNSVKEKIRIEEESERDSDEERGIKKERRLAIKKERDYRGR